MPAFPARLTFAGKKGTKFMDKNTRQETFPILGMSCAACAARVDKTLNQQPGVCQAAVNYAAATALVEYDPAKTSPEALQHAVQEAGYDLIITHDEHTEDEVEEAHAKRYKSLKRRTTWAILLAVPIAVIGMGFMDRPWAGWATWILSTPVVFVLGRSFFSNAWKQLKHRSANMDTLVACSTGVAYLFSVFNLLFPGFWLSRGIAPHVYFESSSVIIAFILLGRLLEERAKGNTSQAIKKLMGLQPKTVTLVINEKLKEVPIRQVKPGDIIRVKPGERIAVDGTVTDGTSYVDESTLSGEPVPVAKGKDAKVYAGTINQKGSFHFRADRVGADTLLAKIIHLVQDAQGSKAPVQKLVDKVAAVFVPAIMGIALLSFILWMAFAPSEGFTPRTAGPGDGAHHRLPLCLGTRHAYRHHGRHRQRSRTGHPHQRRRKPGNGKEGERRRTGQDGHRDRRTPPPCSTSCGQTKKPAYTPPSCGLWSRGRNTRWQKPSSGMTNSGQRLKKCMWMLSIA